MITRPLDLASKLRPEPRNFDLLFLVNGGLIVLFFFLFGSQFVLAPGLGLNFQLPQVPGARAGATATTHRITVKPTGLIFIDDGPADLARLSSWLNAEKGTKPHPSLLIIASKDVKFGTLAEIENIAHAAGFEVQLAEQDPAARDGPEGH